MSDWTTKPNRRTGPKPTRISVERCITVYRASNGSEAWYVYVSSGKSKIMTGRRCASLDEARVVRKELEEKRDAYLAERKLAAAERDAAKREARSSSGSAWRTERSVRLPVIVAADIDTHEVDRPRHRGECVDGPRPCPWMSCRHHLALDVDVFGGLSYHDPDRLDEMPETCALDVAAHGGLTLEEVGDMLGVTRERVRQLEAKGLESIAASKSIRAYRRHLAERGDRDVTEPEAYG